MHPFKKGEAGRAALGGAATNLRFQEIGALDVLPANYSSIPDLVAQGRLGIDVVLTF